MQITFGGVIIAQEPDFGGFDAVTGFIAKGKGNTQWQDFLRATDATPVARGNRKRTLSGRIIPAPAPSLQEAMVQRDTAYNSLPDAGALIIQVGAATITFANAVLDTHEAIEDLQGVAYGFALSFSVGRPAVTEPAVVLTQSGMPILNQSGGDITNQSS